MPAAWRGEMFCIRTCKRGGLLFHWPQSMWQLWLRIGSCNATCGAGCFIFQNDKSCKTCLPEPNFFICGLQVSWVFRFRAEITFPSVRIFLFLGEKPNGNIYAHIHFEHNIVNMSGKIPLHTSLTASEQRRKMPTNTFCTQRLCLHLAIATD